MELVWNPCMDDVGQIREDLANFSNSVLAQARIECVAQPFTDQVVTQHGHEDR